MHSRDSGTDRRRAVVERVNNGKAMERAMAGDEAISRFFDHDGGAGRPDFVRKGTDEGYELTTDSPRTIAVHARRPYVHPDRIMTYESF